MRWPQWVVVMPNGVRQGVIGAAVLGAAGCIAGLIIGLRVYPPTAWFATFELGVPSAFLGFALGAAAGGVLSLLDRHSPSP